MDTLMNLMNLMNLERDFTPDRILFLKIGCFLKINYVVDPAIWACKFIKFIFDQISNYFMFIITNLLLKTVINDEYMNTYEQTCGLFPAFTIGIVNR